MNPSDIAAVYPEIIVTVVAMIVLVAGATLGERRQGAILAIITVAGLLVAFASVFGAVAPGQYFRGFVTIDAFTTFFRAIFILLAVFAALVSPAYLARRRVPAGEYYAIICFSTVGAMTIALSSDLITLFVGLETMTIPIYVLAGIQRTAAARLRARGPPGADPCRSRGPARRRGSPRARRRSPPAGAA